MIVYMYYQLLSITIHYYTIIIRFYNPRSTDGSHPFLPPPGPGLFGIVHQVLPGTVLAVQAVWTDVFRYHIRGSCRG